MALEVINAIYSFFSVLSLKTKIYVLAHLRLKRQIATRDSWLWCSAAQPRALLWCAQLTLSQVLPPSCCLFFNLPESSVFMRSKEGQQWYSKCEQVRRLVP